MTTLSLSIAKEIEVPHWHAAKTIYKFHLCKFELQ